VFTKASLVAGRQAPLRRAYLEDPQRAVSVKWAATKAGAGADAFHSVVEIGKGYGVSQRLGLDRLVGGDHDLPNPADLLCAALAACEDSAVRACRKPQSKRASLHCANTPKRHASISIRSAPASQSL
jgi:hypothetical protein